MSSVVIDHVLGLEDGQPLAERAAENEPRRAGCVAHASLVWLAALALAALGAVSIYALPSSIYPEMQFPRVVVVAHAGQLSPELVEAQVTRPLEEALAVVPGVRHVRARTIRGAVELSLLLVDGDDPLHRAVRVSGRGRSRRAAEGHDDDRRARAADVASR